MTFRVLNRKPHSSMLLIGSEFTKVSEGQRGLQKLILELIVDSPGERYQNDISR
jgi:hypothetical protein